MPQRREQQPGVPGKQLAGSLLICRSWISSALRIFLSLSLKAQADTLSSRPDILGREGRHNSLAHALPPC